jgi:hypothetical protein
VEIGTLVTTGVNVDVDEVATVVVNGDAGLEGVFAVGGVQKPGIDCVFFPLLLLYSADSLINRLIDSTISCRCCRSGKRSCIMKPCQARLLMSRT